MFRCKILSIPIDLDNASSTERRVLLPMCSTLTVHNLKNLSFLWQSIYSSIRIGLPFTLKIATTPSDTVNYHEPSELCAVTNTHIHSLLQQFLRREGMSTCDSPTVHFADYKISSVYSV